MLTTSNVFDLINYFSQTLWLSVGASVVGMLWLRKTKPDIPRPIKVNLIIPCVFLIAIGFLVVIPAITQPKDTAIGVAILLSGIPVYYACVKWQSKPKAYDACSSGILRFLQKICSCVYVESLEKMSNWTTFFGWMDEIDFHGRGWWNGWLERLLRTNVTLIVFRNSYLFLISGCTTEQAPAQVMYV